MCPGCVESVLHTENPYILNSQGPDEVYDAVGLCTSRCVLTWVVSPLNALCWLIHIGMSSGRLHYLI